MPQPYEHRSLWTYSTYLGLNNSLVLMDLDRRTLYRVDVTFNVAGGRATNLLCQDLGTTRPSIYSSESPER